MCVSVSVWLTRHTPPSESGHCPCHIPWCSDRLRWTPCACLGSSLGHRLWAIHIFTDITEMRFKAFYSILHDFIAIKCLLAFHGPSGMGLVRAILEDISMLIDLKNRDMQKKKCGFYIIYDKCTNSLRIMNKKDMAAKCLCCSNKLDLTK